MTTKKSEKQTSLPSSLPFNNTLRNEVTVEPFSETNTFLPAFRYKNLEFFGGKRWDIGAEILFDLIINLTGSKFIFTYPVIDNPTIFANLVKEIEIVRATPQLVIKWEDYGVPDIPPSMWHGLVEDLRSFAVSKPNEVLTIGVFCDGGTGRTGTALAILRSLLLKDYDSDPIIAIRADYKHDAVETLRQVMYVEKITGVDSVCTGSKPVKGYKPVTTTSTQTSTPSGKPAPLTAPDKSVAFTCTHTLAIPGCPGGCVQFYAKGGGNKGENSQSVSKRIPTADCDGCKFGTASYPHTGECNATNKAYLERVVDEEEGEFDTEDFDCPACKLGGAGIAHTVECNRRYMEKSGVCGECFENVEKTSHATACSMFGTEDDDKNWVDALIDRMTNRTEEQIESCEGCVAGETDAAFHTKECNDNYFKTSDTGAPF